MLKRFLFLALKVAIVVGVVSFVYGYVDGFAAMVFHGPFPHLNQTARVMVSATLAGGVGLALGAALARWDPWIF